MSLASCYGMRDGAVCHISLFWIQVDAEAKLGNLAEREGGSGANGEVCVVAMLTSKRSG